MDKRIKRQSQRDANLMYIGITASAFDILHVGHVAMLEDAKKHCDYLICCLQVDPSLERPEKNPPLQSLVERYIQLQAVRYVDEIIPYEREKDLQDIIEIKTPDIRIIGEEYKSTEFTGKKLCPVIHYNKRRHRFSSTHMRIRMSRS